MKEKASLHHTHNLWGVDYITLNLYKSIYHPLNFQKLAKLLPKDIIKKHSKSQKNHKTKNTIVLDSKWVDLYNEHRIWYALVQFFTATKKNIDLKLQQKIYTKGYHIIYSLCRFTHLKSTTSVSKYLSMLTFFATLTIHLIQKIIANM
jgi:hypothetical protein